MNERNSDAAPDRTDDVRKLETLPKQYDTGTELQ